MTGSFVIYKERDFEANDVGLQIWLYYVIQEVKKDPNQDDWTDELTTDWMNASTLTSLGTVFARLDHFADTPSHQHRLIKYSEAALDQLRSQETISVEELSRKRVGGEVRYYEDIPSEKIVKIGARFARLLKGEPLDV